MKNLVVVVFTLMMILLPSFLFNNFLKEINESNRRTNLLHFLFCFFSKRFFLCDRFFFENSLPRLDLLRPARLEISLGTTPPPATGNVVIVIIVVYTRNSYSNSNFRLACWARFERKQKTPSGFTRLYDVLPWIQYVALVEVVSFQNRLFLCVCS